MGCQPSKDSNTTDIISVSNQSQDIDLNYRQLVSQDRGYVFDLYHFSTMVSRSNYSIVRRAINRSSKQQRICKIIPLANKKYMSVMSQIQYLKKVNHPNIVQVIQYFVDSSIVYIIFEEIPGGKLLNQLLGREVTLVTLQQIFLQLLSTVKYLQNKMIAHRALTHQNVLLFWIKEKPFLKIIDFSQAAPIGCPNPTVILNSKRSIPIDSDNKQLSKIDVFDCGLLFWSMLSGKKVKPDWLDNYKLKIKQAVQNMHLDKQIEKDLCDLLQKMLIQNTKKRCTISECIQHKFFQHFKNKNIPKTKSLKQFLSHPLKQVQSNQLKQFLQMYASLTMTSPLQKAELMIQFNNLDTNKDGEIQLEQLTEGIKNIYKSTEQQAIKYSESVFNKLDKNKDGSLQFSQYVLGTIDLTKFLTNQFLMKMFKQLDVNSDGFLEQDEIRDMIGDGVILSNRMLGKGRVDFKKFAELMKTVVKEANQCSAQHLSIHQIIQQEQE